MSPPPAYLSSQERSAVRAPLERASTLPPRCYVDPDLYALEEEQVFRSGWLAVARVDQVSKPSDFLTLDLLGEPLLLVRDESGRVRVLSNVCRHRSMPVASGSGNGKSFQCPYHLWSYGLDGRLLGAPEMQRAEGFEKTDCRLPSLRSETWGGFVFVNLDGAAEPLAPQLAPLERHVTPYRLAEQRSTERLDYDCPWNWKVSIENGSESYHHLGLHRSILEGLLPAALSDIAAPSGPYSLYWNPSKTGEPLGTLLPSAPDLSERQRASLQLITIFPSTLFFMNPDFTAWLQLVPHAVDHHTLHYVPLVQPEALKDPEVESKLAQVRAVLDAVHQQDMAGCAAVWRGLRSRLARPGRVSHLEGTIWQFQNWLLDRLEPAEKPETEART